MSVGKKILIAVDIILFLFTFVSYKNIFDLERCKTVYAEESSKFVEETENPVFRINKIVLWSSAFAVDNSEGELTDIDISQYTDIEVYIDNLSRVTELTPENTVNEIYIDNIVIDTNEINRDVRFNYKNPYTCGKFVELKNYDEDGITFRVLRTNEKQAEADFNDPVFYTDCTNPITLGLVNKDFITNCEIGGDSGLIGFDGSILSKISQDIKTLNSKISFDIHIVNNYNEDYICKVILHIDLTENNNAINAGYLKTEINGADNKLYFFKQ